MTKEGRNQGSKQVVREELNMVNIRERIFEWMDRSLSKNDQVDRLTC